MNAPQTANRLLKTAEETLVERGVERDSPAGERSMGRTVAAFNALTGRDLTEQEGWKFMVVLKLSRSATGRNPDDYVDGAAYIALAGESALQADRSIGEVHYTKATSK